MSLAAGSAPFLRKVSANLACPASPVSTEAPFPPPQKPARGHAKAAFREAQALQSLGQARDAIAAVRRCLSAQPSSAPALDLLRRLHVQHAADCRRPQADELRREACERPPAGWEWSHVPSPDPCSQNLVLLLHGLGDTAEPYAALARRLKIPQVGSLWRFLAARSCSRSTYMGPGIHGGSPMLTCMLGACRSRSIPLASLPNTHQYAYGLPTHPTLPSHATHCPSCPTIGTHARTH